MHFTYSILLLLCSGSQASHYGKPPCESDEVEAKVSGSGGVVCAAHCDHKPCPVDVPAGSMAEPKCWLYDSKSRKRYCALACAATSECPAGAACVQIDQLTQVCVYNQSMTSGSIALSPWRSDDPEQPHLAQAWTALSSGDGLPGAIGQESYIYTDDPEYSKSGGIRGHLFKYGDSCQKLELNQWKPTLIQKSYYLKCDAVDCCYKPDTIVKKWDFHSFFAKVSFGGYVNTTELNNKTVLGAERWVETDKIPFGEATYEYFITRSGSDIITHRINYGGSKVNPGAILYGNFSVKHDLRTFSKTFAQPSGDCSLQCPDAMVAKWESSYFNTNVQRSLHAVFI